MLSFQIISIQEELSSKWSPIPNSWTMENAKRFHIAQYSHPFFGLGGLSFLILSLLKYIQRSHNFRFFREYALFHNTYFATIPWLWKQLNLASVTLFKCMSIRNGCNLDSNPSNIVLLYEFAFILLTTENEAGGRHRGGYCSSEF